MRPRYVRLPGFALAADDDLSAALAAWRAGAGAGLHIDVDLVCPDAEEVMRQQVGATQRWLLERGREGGNTAAAMQMQLEVNGGNWSAHVTVCR